MADGLSDFDSPRELVGHAREHIDQLEGHIKIFFDRKPYAKVIDFDNETRQQVFKLRITAKLPSPIRLIFKDATSNLRDALDHAVYASAIALGVNNPKKTGFPFANDSVHLQSELGTWKFSDVPREIHPVLMSFNPYPTGNDLLVGLNRMRNPNTHRAIVPIAFADAGNAITASTATIVGGGQLGYSLWDATKNEVEYMRLGIGSTFNGNVEFAFNVTFGDIDIVADKPVVSTLREIANEVDRIVLGLEAETTRLIALRT
jgi:hypothetical protein